MAFRKAKNILGLKSFAAHSSVGHLKYSWEEGPERESQVTNASNSQDFPNQEVMAWEGESNVDAFDAHLLGIEKLPFNMGSSTSESSWNFEIQNVLTCTRGWTFKERLAHFWCNLLKQIKLLCLIWKLWMSPFICCMVAFSAPRGYRVTDQEVEDVGRGRHTKWTRWNWVICT